MKFFINFIILNVFFIQVTLAKNVEMKVASELSFLKNEDLFSRLTDLELDLERSQIDLEELHHRWQLRKKDALNKIKSNPGLITKIEKKINKKISTQVDLVPILEKASNQREHKMNFSVKELKETIKGLKKILKGESIDAPTLNIDPLTFVLFIILPILAISALIVGLVISASALIISGGIYLSLCLAVFVIFATGFGGGVGYRESSARYTLLCS